MASDGIVCLITASKFEEAELIANALVEKKLASCCSIIRGVVSIYEWEGKINRSEECQLIVKTNGEKLDRLVATAKKLHSYEVPEIIALPIIGGLPSYLSWLDK
ncbi:MAG: divalent-cation tolerance protein CutA [Nitrospinae bacterium]|nr:divalent-cation tolerance protein CutA [Nitrospinota bacterium]